MRFIGLLAVVNLAACHGRDAANGSGQAPASTTPGDSNRGWTVTVRGMGPLQAGMSRKEAEAVVGRSLGVPGDSMWRNCAYAPTDSLPPGTHIMVENGTVARIDVDSSATIATTEGARTGSAESDVLRLYAGRIAVTPHKYTSGHYLTVRSSSPADSLFRIVFETDGQRVLTYRSGRVPSVEQVERCG